MRNVDRVVAALEGCTRAKQFWLVGEPCFAPPGELVEGYIQALRTPSYRYPPHNGLPELRNVLAAHHSKKGHEVAPDQITVTSGAKAGLLALLATILEPGDELIHPQPCYPAYPKIASRIGARPVAVPENGNGFAAWAEVVESKIGPRTRAVVLSSPSNPTGTSLSSSATKTLTELCRDRGLRLICDQAYVDFRFADDRELLPSDLDRERTTVVQVRSASKSWALCGWRVGWLVANASLISRVARTHASLVNPASGPAQAALCALPTISDDYLRTARKLVSHRMRELCSVLESIGLPVSRPEGGFYLWLNVADLVDNADMTDAVAWCEEIGRRYGVGLWPGQDFGDSACVRLAYTAPSDSDWLDSVVSLKEALTVR